MKDSIAVLIVDNDDSFREKTHTLLKSVNGITVVGEAKGGQKAIDLIHETHPDVVLVDIGPRHASNLQTVAQICQLFPQIKIIVLNDDDQAGLVLEAFRAGALGHLVKEKAQSVEIVKAIRAVYRGEAILSPGIAGHILDEVIKTQEEKNES